MTYHQMRLLVAGLARYDGRLGVLTARSQGPDGTWTVVLQDHARHTWLRLRRIEQLAEKTRAWLNFPLLRPPADCRKGISIDRFEAGKFV